VPANTAPANSVPANSVPANTMPGTRPVGSSHHDRPPAMNVDVGADRA